MPEFKPETADEEEPPSEPFRPEPSHSEPSCPPQPPSPEFLHNRSCQHKKCSTQEKARAQYDGYMKRA